MDQIENNEELHVELRKSTHIWMKENKKFLLPSGKKLSSATDKNWDDLTNEVSIEGTWGTSITLWAIANLLNVHITVAHSKHESLQNFFPTNFKNDVIQKIYLYNDNDIHYVSVTPLTKNNKILTAREFRIIKKECKN